MSSDAGSSRRSRAAGFVTVNACTECRKKRAKCDGQTPCARCIAQKGKCIYEIPIRQSKENMRAEIIALRDHFSQSERILRGLTSPQSEGILERLRNSESIANICHWLDTCEHPQLSHSTTAYPSVTQQEAVRGALPSAEEDVVSNENAFKMQGIITEQSPSATFSDPNSGRWASQSTSQSSSSTATPVRPMIGSLAHHYSSDTINRAPSSGQVALFGPNEETEYTPSSNGYSWTQVTPNSEFVEHLMALYFCWEYPTFATISRDQFLADYRLGRARYCSDLLVNAMLALGCRFSNLPESRVDEDDPETAGNHFFAEAKRLFQEEQQQEGHMKLTTIQALGLMSIREASCGRDTESFYYSCMASRLTVETGLHLESEEADQTEKQVRRCTFWGAFTLDQAWCLTLGRMPHISGFLQLPPKPTIIISSESSAWVPYTDSGVPELKSRTQPSNVHSVFKCFCELSELIHKGLHTLYTPGRILASADLLDLYTTYLNWYDDLPEALRLGYNFTPAVLFSHLYYHFAILMLFRPFIKLSLHHPSKSPDPSASIPSTLSLRQICIQAANTITTLVRSYDQLYTLARTPSFVPYIILASGIMHLVTGMDLDGETKEFARSDPHPDVLLHPIIPKGGDGLRLSEESLSQSTKEEKSPAAQYQIKQGLEDLNAMRSCHGFAQRGLQIMRVLARQWGIEELLRSEADDSEMKDARRERERDEDDQACKPSRTSSNMFCPNLGTILTELAPRGRGGLFSPFPMQGLPLVEIDRERARGKDGFRRL